MSYVPKAGEDDDEVGIVPARLAILIGVLVLVVLLAGWQLLLIIFAVAGFIIVHETGHYLLAKWSGMKVTEFFIFFGPRIFSFRRGDTVYGLKTIPAGAYVRIIGMNNLEEVDPEDEERAYRSRSWHKRFLTVAAGPATHFVMAAIILVFALWRFGPVVDDVWQVDSVVEGSAASEADLQPGDRIVAVNGIETVGFSAVVDQIEVARGEVVEFTIDTYNDAGEVVSTRSAETRIRERLTEVGSTGFEGLYAYDTIVGFDGQPVQNYEEFAALAAGRIGETVPVDVEFSQETTKGFVKYEKTESVVINSVATEGAVAGYLGIARDDVRTPTSFSGALTDAVPATWELTGALVSHTGDVFSSAVGWRSLFALPIDEEAVAEQRRNDPSQYRPSETVDENRIISIIGAIRIGSDLFDRGTAEVLFFLAGLNISLGMINLLPLLPFDGGHMMVATYERLRSFGGREHRVDANKLLPLTYVVVAFMVLVGVIAMVRDVIDPIQL